LLSITWLETRTSVIESELLASTAARLRYRIEPAPSDNIAFPHSGPLDVQRGYSRIPEFVPVLQAKGYKIREQSSFSPGLMLLSRIGVPLPYRPAPVAGLVIRDERGATLFDGAKGHHLFRVYAEIPPIVERSLLF